MKIPEGWPTQEMVEAALDNLPNVNREDVVFALKGALAVAPTPPAQNRESLVYDLTAPVPFKTPPAQDNNKAIADYNEPAMGSSWQYLKTQLDSKGWTTGEAFTYRGFFAWGWEARRQHDAPPAQEDEPLCPRPVNGKPDNTTMAECILAGECGCTVKGTEYGKEKLAAQEDEPVGYVEPQQIEEYLAEQLNYLIVFPHRFCSEQATTPLYTRPDNDKLRKAAERADTSLETLLYRVAEGIDHLPLTESIRAIRKTLRDALKEK